MSIKKNRDQHTFDVTKAIRVEEVIRPIKATGKTRPVLVYIFPCRLCPKEIRVDTGRLAKHSGFCKTCSLLEYHKEKAVLQGIPNGSKRCSKCKDIKLLDFFGFNGLKPRSYCKRCDNTQSLQWHRDNYERSEVTRKKYRKENVEKYRESRLRSRCSRYGISIEKYSQMLETQKGVCSICGLEEINESRKRLCGLAIDHDHSCCSGNFSCGKCVAGLLCTRCNTAIAMMQDDPELIVKMLAYVLDTRRKTNGGSG